MKQSIQIQEKRLILLLEVNQIGGFLGCRSVSSLLQAAGNTRLRIIFPGKHESYITLLVGEWHPIGE